MIQIDKPQKEDIANYIKNKYADFQFDEYPLDVTDSIAVTLTLLNKKWNSDIVEKNKELKKEQKTAKARIKIEKLDSDIDFLESLKI